MAHRLLVPALLSVALLGAQAEQPTSDLARTGAAAPKPPARPNPPTRLLGTVKGPDGRPIQGALVLYHARLASDREGSATTRTDASGRFQAELKSSGPLLVRVEAAGFAARTFERVEPGSPLAVVLDRGLTLEGLVRDAAGQPVAHARVRAMADVRPPISLWDATEHAVVGFTDAFGRYRLDTVGAGLQSVTATARGYGVARKLNVRPGATANLVLQPGAWVDGRVLGPDGRPLKGALVRATREPRFFETGATETTDALGRFELPGLEAGTYTLIARHKDFAPALTTGVAVGAEGGTEATLALGAGTRLIGRLVGPAEQPIPGRVVVQELAGQQVPRSLLEVLRAEAGADGRFSIERVPQGPFVLGIVAPGAAGRRLEGEGSGRGAVMDLGDIALERGLVISGRVRTSSGAAVADAELMARPRGMLPGNPSEARSEVDGSFVLAGLGPGPCRVQVTAAGFAALEKVLPAGSEGVDLTLSPGGALTGVVVDDAGRPVDSYQVVVNPTEEQSRRRGSARASVGSADGRFLLEDLAEGAYVLTVMVPERAPTSISGVKVVGGRSTDAGTIRVARGGVVRGEVVDAAGHGVLGATVRVQGPGMNALAWGDSMTQALTEPSGSFELRGVEEGRQQLVATHPDYAPGEFPVNVDALKGPVETRLVLSRGGRIEGVAHRRDGTPLSGLEVEHYSETHDQLNLAPRPGLTTGADGAFAIDHVPPGLTQVNLMSTQGPGLLASVLSKSVEVHEGETVSLEFVSREILVSGHVTRSGAPLAGARIRLSGEGGMTWSVTGGADLVAAASGGPQPNAAVSGEDGSFELIVAVAGRYWVSVESGDGRMRYPRREILVPDVEAHAVELALSGVPVVGIVVDRDTEEPVAQAFVRAHAGDKDGRGSTAAQAGPDGRFALDLDPGDYTFSAGADGYGQARRTASVGASGLDDLRLELPKGRPLRGRVVDGAGRGVSGILVTARAVDASTSSAETLPDGSFVMPGLDAESYNLCAGAESAGYAMRVGVAPGEGDVSLALRPPGVVRLLVRGPDGAPLSRAYSDVVSVGGMPVEVPWVDSHPTDAMGQVELPTPAGFVEIEVAREKLRGTAHASVAEGTTATAEVTLSEPAEKPR